MPPTPCPLPVFTAHFLDGLAVYNPWDVPAQQQGLLGVRLLPLRKIGGSALSDTRVCQWSHRKQGERGGFKASDRTAFRLYWKALSSGLPHIPTTYDSGSCLQALARSWMRVEARGGREGFHVGFQIAKCSGPLFLLGCLEIVPAQSVSVSIHQPCPTTTAFARPAPPIPPPGPKGPFY